MIDSPSLPAPALLVRAVARPETLATLSVRDWERLVACARRNAVLAYLGLLVEREKAVEKMPPEVHRHLLGARRDTSRVAQLARWELNRIRHAVGSDVALLALKGAGYLVRGLAFADTRPMSDVDILVPREHLNIVETSLVAAGWEAPVLNAYDQQYYRRWMHELPPLQFPGRTLGVDIHHTISPPVSRIKPDPGLFWHDAEVTDFHGYRVLSPADTFLHSAVHLFFDSDFRDRFRDLVDLHELATEFGRTPGFWDALGERARRQGLTRPLYHATYMLRRVLGTSLPQAFVREIATAAPAQPAKAMMQTMLTRMLRPADPEDWPRRHGLTLWLLYVRSHWLRMPPHLLIPHLLRKGLRGARKP